MKLTIEINRKLTKKESKALTALLESLSSGEPQASGADAPPPTCGPGEQCP